jgi:adenylate cyclase
MPRPQFTRHIDPREIQAHIAQSGSYDLKIGEYNPHECAVLFFDLCNFTNISWSLSTDQILSILQPFFERVGYYVSLAGGMIDKYPGDGVVAFIPRDYSAENNTIADDALDCAAKAMGWFYTELRPRIRLPKATHTLELSVGLDAGWIAVAHVGSAIHSELILLGHDVNCASKCQSAAENREVVIGQDGVSLIHYKTLYERFLGTGPAIGVVYTADNRPYRSFRFDWAKCAAEYAWARP